jgi:5-methylcytosine-specific restriction endonuclease McrA
MRPIEKLQPGDEINYENSRGATICHIVQATYNKYRDAQLPLSRNFGCYCSYCERSFDVVSLEVEHMEAVKNGGSETDWNNFLLSCKLCNTIKSTRNVDDSHWPHLNNTYLDFVYKEDGRVKLNPNLTGLSRNRAQNLYNLVQLGRDDKDATARDFRWRDRYEAWNIATKAKTKYDEGKYDEDDVIKYAQLSGCWSVWFTVFAGVDAILSRLITDFAGTCKSCFDATKHYEPIPRNTSNEADPI